MISIKDVEEVFRELARISGGEEPRAEEREFLPAEAATWIISHEIFVPVCESIGRSDRETNEYGGWDWVKERCLPGIEFVLGDWRKKVLSCVLAEVGDREDLVASHNKCSSGGLRAALV